MDLPATIWIGLTTSQCTERVGRVVDTADLHDGRITVDLLHPSVAIAQLPQRIDVDGRAEGLRAVV